MKSQIEATQTPRTVHVLCGYWNNQHAEYNYAVLLDFLHGAFMFSSHDHDLLIELQFLCSVAATRQMLG